MPTTATKQALHPGLALHALQNLKLTLAVDPAIKAAPAILNLPEDAGHRLVQKLTKCAGWSPEHSSTLIAFDHAGLEPFDLLRASQVLKDNFDLSLAMGAPQVLVTHTRECTYIWNTEVLDVDKLNADFTEANAADAGAFTSGLKATMRDLATVVGCEDKIEEILNLPMDDLIRRARENSNRNVTELFTDRNLPIETYPVEITCSELTGPLTCAPAPATREYGYRKEASFELNLYEPAAAPANPGIFNLTTADREKLQAAFLDKGKWETGNITSLVFIDHPPPDEEEAAALLNIVGELARQPNIFGQGHLVMLPLSHSIVLWRTRVANPTQQGKKTLEKVGNRIDDVPVEELKAFLDSINDPDLTLPALREILRTNPAEMVERHYYSKYARIERRLNHLVQGVDPELHSYLVKMVCTSASAEVS